MKNAVGIDLDIDDFAGRLSFFFCSGNDLFEEVAKFRAARRLWARIMKEKFDAKKPKSMMLRFHTQTSGSVLTAQQPDNNIIRVAIQALAAVLGGTQSLHTNSKEEALSLPPEESVRIALRTQQILAYESGVAQTVDPLGGSYYVEALTDGMCEKAWEYIEKIENMGGMIRAIEKGYVQKEIQDAAYQYQIRIASGEQVVIGLNKFYIEEPPLRGLPRVDPSIRDIQIQKLENVKKTRDDGKVKDSLENLRKGAQESSRNLMPYILDAVKAYATIEEICTVLKQEFGEFQEIIVV